MAIFHSDPFAVGPIRASADQIISGPWDPRHAAFWVSVTRGGEPVYRRLTNASGAFTTSSSDELAREIAQRLQRRSRIPIVAVGGLVACVASASVSGWLSAVVVVAAIVMAFVVRAADAARRTTFVLYSLTDEAEVAYQGVLNGAEWIARSERRSSARGSVNVTSATSPITTNVAAPELSVGPIRLQFLPDGLLVLYGTSASLVPYAEMKTNATRSRELQEYGTPASDSPRVGERWRYQRKDGSPDRRRKVNPRLPLVEVGKLTISADDVVSESLSVSNPAAAEHFRDAIDAMSGRAPIVHDAQRSAAPTRPITRATSVETAAPAAFVSGSAPGNHSVAPPKSTPSHEETSDQLARTVMRAETRLSIGKAIDPPNRTALVDGNALWVAPFRRVTVHELTIGGFVYVGQQLRGLDAHLPEPALINPSRPIGAWNTAVVADEQIGYSPTYDRLTPSVRGAYLNWLARGRDDADAPIAFVFLFFYGLERRVFEYLDGKGSDTAESIAIAREVERLLSVYKHESFGWHASSLLDLLSAREPELIAPSAGDYVRPGEELPFKTRVALGKLAAAGAALSPELALQWLRNGEGVLRTPAVRCPSEFEKLFAIRYSQHIPGGLRVRANKTRLVVRYTPASSALRERSVKIDGLPDITALTQPLQELEKIADLCCNELDPYSRWIAKNPQSAQSLAAISLLPAELVGAVESDDARMLSSFLVDRLQGAPHVVIGSDELLLYWPVVNPLKVAKSEAVQLAQVLDRLGFSMEPDVRFGGQSPASGGSIVVFRRAVNAPATASPEYTSALLLARLSVVVAKADGVFTPAEKDAVNKSIADAFNFTEAERHRLDAHVEWLAHAKLGTAGLKKLVASLAPDQHARIASYVARVAAADGTVDTTEMRALEKLYKSLGLTNDDLYRNVHSVMSDSADTPSTPKLPRSGVALDMARVKTKLAETASVSSLLADIFADDEDAPPPVSVPLTAAATSLGKLDAAQAAFLRGLVARGEWPRLDVELLASQHAVLVDGALEAINDYAFDRCGDPVWEGDDPITINDHVAKEILA